MSHWESETRWINGHFQSVKKREVIPIIISSGRFSLPQNDGNITITRDGTEEVVHLVDTSTTVFQSALSEKQRMSFGRKTKAHITVNSRLRGLYVSDYYLGNTVLSQDDLDGYNAVYEDNGESVNLNNIVAELITNCDEVGSQLYLPRLTYVVPETSNNWTGTNATRWYMRTGDFSRYSATRSQGQTTVDMHYETSQITDFRYGNFNMESIKIPYGSDINYSYNCFWEGATGSFLTNCSFYQAFYYKWGDGFSSALRNIVVTLPSGRETTVLFTYPTISGLMEINAL